MSSDSSSENEVNDLAQEIDKPLPISKKRKVTELDPDSEEDEEQNILNNGISSETKNKIYTVLRDITKEEVINNEKMLDIINKVTNFTEEQARTYLEMLTFARNFKLNKNFAKRALHLLATKMVHKNDPDTAKEIVDDEHIISSLTHFIGLALSRLGSGFSGVIVFASYIFYSHYVYGTLEKTLTETTVQDDGKRQESNGQNNINGEINANRMGE